MESGALEPEDAMLRSLLARATALEQSPKTRGSRKQSSSTEHLGQRLEVLKELYEDMHDFGGACDWQASL